jgi:hypothetical protein
MVHGSWIFGCEVLISCSADYLQYFYCRLGGAKRNPTPQQANIMLVNVGFHYP